MVFWRRTVFERLNIEGIIVNLSPSDTIECKSMELKIRKCTLVDEGGSIPLSLYADLTDVVTEKVCYKLTNRVVIKYKSTRLLQTTERTTITLSTDQKIMLDVQDFVDETKKTVEATVISIKLDSFAKSIMCPNYKAPIKTDDDNFAECSSCESKCPPKVSA